MIWYQEKNDNDIMVSTRIRLARNLKKFPFPNAMTIDDAKKAAQTVRDAIMEGNSTLAKEFRVLDVEATSEKEKQMLYEKHLISPEMMRRKAGLVLLSEDSSMSIMLMEEDHIRLQIIRGGFCPDAAWELANKVDDVLEERLEYAFDQEFGYLTSCPTNVGTGLRVSVMMHLPALTMTDNITRIINSAAQLGIAVRGMYGEGSKAYGNLYQISNQVTLGMSEQDLLEKVKRVAGQIAEREQEARKALQDTHTTQLADRLWRAYGTLRYAQVLSSQEAKSLLSDVILGKSMQIIDTIPQNPWQLMVETEPACIAQKITGEPTPETRDLKRAEIIRKQFATEER